MLRPYQRDILNRIPQDGNSLLVLPTGGGKTYMFTTYIKEQNTPTCAIAHRQELVGQMSLSLAQSGIHHNIIGSDRTVSDIIKAHRETLGKVYFDPTSSFVCASVDTLIRRSNKKLFDSIRLWVQDEAHHVLKENKWGKAAALFPNARGVGVTATPTRADGKGLGRHSDGLFDHLITGPTGDDLIDEGYLSPYQLIGPPVKDVDWSSLEKGSTGDYKQNQLATATKGSRTLTGSVVNTYLTKTPGKLGICFCVDVEHAERITNEFQKAGVSCELVTANTPFLQRVRVMEKFRRGQVRMLVNVDLFGEGVDVPAVEVVIMARKTASFALFSQQFGRALRPVYAPYMPLDTAEQRKAAIAAGPKPTATIIDHVENWRQHLLPTARKDWTLDASEKKSNSNVDPELKLRSCLNELCMKPYKAILIKCPYCGHTPQRSPRPGAGPVEVDGDLELIDLDMVRELQNKISKIDNPVRLPNNVSKPVALSIMKKHSERSAAQKDLRDAISSWAGQQVHIKGYSIPEAQKLFYHTFGKDVLTAQTLGKRDAERLQQEIKNAIE